MSLGKKQIFGLIAFLILLIAIPVSLYLVSKQQTLKSKATLDTTRIEIIGLSVKDGKTTSRDVKIKTIYVSSAVSSSTQSVNILELKFFPLDSSGTKLNPTITGTNDDLSNFREKVNNFTLQGLSKLTEGTKYHGYKNQNVSPAIKYNLVDSKEFLTALPVSSNEIPWKKGQGVYRPDYKKILSDLNICDYVDNKEVKQVWLWGYHFGNIEPVESNMSMGRLSQSFWNHGTFGDISNSEQIDDLPICNKTYVLYNYNFTRGLGEMLEDHGHHLESVMAFVDKTMWWDTFVGSFGKGGNTINRCGWTHAPPNTFTDYDWRNEREVQSDCEDWKPQGGGEIKTISCHTWYGSTCSDDSGAGFKVWWMQNVPGLNNNLTYQDQQLRNWWEFYADFDLALQQGKTLTMPENIFPTHFRLANSAEDLSSAKEIPFDINNTEVNWQLTDQLGIKNVYAQFKINNIWTSDVSTTIELTSITSPTPTPTSSPSASITPSSIPSLSPSPTQQIKKGDLNHDGVVNTIDASILKSYINKASFPQETDLNLDGKINSMDFAIIKSLIGK